MRWSPFFPLLSGVSPLPHFSHASIDLQIWIPRSFTMFVFTTRLPFACIICASDHPSRLLRTCPRCRGLLVLGDEYSIITSGLSSVAFLYPKSASALMSLSRLIHASCDTTRLRNPLTTLKSATTEVSFSSCSPISCAVSFGFFFDVLRNGNTTSVRLPSNPSFVFCN